MRTRLYIPWDTNGQRWMHETNAEGAPTQKAKALGGYRHRIYVFNLSFGTICHFSKYRAKAKNKKGIDKSTEEIVAPHRLELLELALGESKYALRCRLKTAPGHCLEEL